MSAILTATGRVREWLEAHGDDAGLGTLGRVEIEGEVRGRAGPPTGTRSTRRSPGTAGRLPPDEAATATRRLGWLLDDLQAVLADIDRFEAAHGPLQRGRGGGPVVGRRGAPPPRQRGGVVRRAPRRGGLSTGPWTEPTREPRSRAPTPGPRSACSPSRTRTTGRRSPTSTGRRGRSRRSCAASSTTRSSTCGTSTGASRAPTGPATGSTSGSTGARTRRRWRRCCGPSAGTGARVDERRSDARSRHPRVRGGLGRRPAHGHGPLADRRRDVRPHRDRRRPPALPGPRRGGAPDAPADGRPRRHPVCPLGARPAWTRGTRSSATSPTAGRWWGAPRGRKWSPPVGWRRLPAMNALPRPRRGFAARLLATVVLLPIARRPPAAARTRSEAAAGSRGRRQRTPCQGRQSQDIDGVATLACAARQDQIKSQFDLSGQLGDSLPGVDASVLDAVHIDTSGVKVGTPVVNGDNAQVPRHRLDEGDVRHRARCRRSSSRDGGRRAASR